MQPAAVLLYDQRGCAPVFVVDLDSSQCGVGVVERDLGAIEDLLEGAGLHAWFSDRSVSGGRHLYVPLAIPVPHFEARQVSVALEQMHESVDAMPMRGATDGCIRPPGAWHRRGGHQVLDGTIEAAEAALNAPNDPLAWRSFVVDVLTKINDVPRIQTPALVTTAEIATQFTPRAPVTATETNTALTPRAPVTTTETNTALTPHALVPPLQTIGKVKASSPLPSVSGAPEDQLEPLRGFDEPDAKYQHIARTGEYDTSRYKTPSEAREGVIWACVASGWAFSDVVRRLHDGTWPGLAGFFARYSTAQRHGAVQRDWRKAIAFEKSRRATRGDRHVRTATTSTRKTQGRATPRGGHDGSKPRSKSQVEGFVREWLVAVELVQISSSDLVVRSVLQALAQLAIVTGRLEIEVGNRCLAVGASTDNGTISRVLRKLLAEPSDRGLVDLVQEGRGVRANVIALRIPPLLAPACAARPWRRGRIHGIRAAFRDLGRTAAFVYDALEQLEAPTGGREIASKARLSPSAAYEALQTLAAWGLATNTGVGWTIGTASLAHLAEVFGVDEAVRTQIERYRTERRSWWAWLVAHGLLDPVWIEERSAPPPQLEPPPRPTWTDTTSCVDLIPHDLGAEAVGLAG